jgi:hypothetical protein
VTNERKTLHEIFDFTLYEKSTDRRRRNRKAQHFASPTHYNSTIDPSTGQPFGWMDVTIPGSPDTSTHTICGQVSSFSLFVIGVASADFMFNTLLEDISNLSSAVTPVGTMRSLRAKVLAARASANRGYNSAAMNQLDALISELNSQSGVNVSASAAATLIAEVKTIQNKL